MFWLLNRMAKQGEDNRRRDPAVEEPLERILRDRFGGMDYANDDRRKARDRYER